MEKNLFLVSLMRVVKVIYMFNLTNIGLNMCVKRILDLFLNLMIEHEPILAIMSVQRNISHGGKKFEKIPVWRGKVGIVHMLTNPAWRESLA